MIGGISSLRVLRSNTFREVNLSVTLGELEENERRLCSKLSYYWMVDLGRFRRISTILRLCDV
jgi:hypothetical protein